MKGEKLASIGGRAPQRGLERLGEGIGLRGVGDERAKAVLAVGVEQMHDEGGELAAGTFELVRTFGLKCQAMFDGGQQLSFRFAKRVAGEENFGKRGRLADKPAGLYAERFEQLRARCEESLGGRGQLGGSE